MQQNLILEPEPWGLPLSEVLLPQHLSALGYTSHAVGKWHLGFFKKAYTPTARGFSSHFGFWNGYQDYYTHTVQASFLPYEGYDMRHNLEVAHDARGHYSTDLFTDEAVTIINRHDTKNSSLFLYLSHLAPHAGNYENPLQAPQDSIKRFTYIRDHDRRTYAAMIWKLDESVGKVMLALKENRMLDHTIVVFVSDNGAPTIGIHPNPGSNWPLKGVKGTPWEGSSRTVALLWSKALQKRRRVSYQLMHISDWLPTLYSAAGGDVSQLTGIDGLDMWDAISQDLPSPRTRLLVNIDDHSGYSALRFGRYKYVNGSALFGNLDTWTENPSSEDESPGYDTGAVLSSMTAKALSSCTNLTTRKEMEDLRHQATLRCNGPDFRPCTPLIQPCVFDVESDPCERQNLYENMSETLSLLEAEMVTYRRTQVKPNNRRSEKFADPKYWNNTWTYWKDLPVPHMKPGQNKCVKTLP
jgi:arylsulfatase A-like enzyme